MANNPESLSQSDPEAWAREHVHISWTHSGKHAATYIAQIKVDGLLFEGRASGLIVKGENLRRDATDAAVRDYLEFVERSRRGSR